MNIKLEEWRIKNLELLQEKFEELNEELETFIFNLKQFDMNSMSHVHVYSYEDRFMTKYDFLFHFFCDNSELKKSIDDNFNLMKELVNNLQKKGFKKLDEIKYLISIKEFFAVDWYKRRNWDKNKIKIITNYERAAGINFTKDNTLIMIGKDYDYPEDMPQVSRTERDNFHKLLDIVNRRIVLNTKSIKLTDLES